MLAVAVQLRMVAGFLAVLAAVLSIRTALGHHALARRVRALVRISHGRASCRNHTRLRVGSQQWRGTRLEDAEIPAACSMKICINIRRMVNRLIVLTTVRFGLTARAGILRVFYYQLIEHGR